MEITILMPCLNEEKTIGKCIDKAMHFLDTNHLNGEVLIVDNGSTDFSLKIIKGKNVRCVRENKKGYGNALVTGIKNARGKYIIMCDCDDSYDLTNLMPFVYSLKNGNDLVIGNRFAKIEEGAMKISHYYGVKVLTFIGNILYGTRLNDYHCGLRAFNKDKILKLNLVCGGMDFASEIIIKSAKNNYKIVEVDTILKKDGREGKSHLRTIRDGILHIKCLFKYISYEEK